MAAMLETSQHKGSDVVYDVCCSICEDDGIYKEGRSYCQKCSKYFCDSCVLTHNKFLKDHSITTKGGGDNWPVNKTVDDALALCEEHTSEKLTMFCEDDEKLLCHVCHLRNHRKCSQVVLLTDKVKTTKRPLDVAHMKTSIESSLERLEDMVKAGEHNTLSLQMSYEKVLEEIVDVRRLINDNLDRLQQNTEKKLEELHSSLNNSLENIRKQCVEFISKIKGYTIENIYKESPERSFIIYRKCLDQTASADLFLRKATIHTAIEFHHNKDLEQFVASCTEFGSITSPTVVSHHCVYPNKVVSIKDTSKYKVRAAVDKTTCSVRAICESSNGEFVIADYNNECVKLLDQTYNLIEQIKIPSSPRSMCKISSNIMALTVGERGGKGIHFLRVEKGSIVKLYTLQLNHSCYGIAFHQGDLFVTSGTAVYQYTINGRLVKTLYEDTSGEYNVGVGVSPDGKRIYVTDCYKGKLLTLARDGAVSTTFQDTAFKTSILIPNLHVAATGQVFVVGKKSVSQVDTDGKTILNTIQLDIANPNSVYFNEDTSKMIVGFGNEDKVIEFTTN